MESEQYQNKSYAEDEAGQLDYNSISMRAINTSTRLKMSQLLNVHQALTNTKNVARDYRGLAELMGFEYIDIRNFERSNDPTKEIIEAWESKAGSSVGALIKVLDELERFDVLDEVTPLIEDNVRSWLSVRRKNETVTQNSTKPSVYSNISEPLCPDMENPLSVDDTVNTTNFYHAYVCYADCDFDFVLTLSKCLERKDVGLKLFIRDRDLQLGVLQYDAYLRLIEERCKHVLVILSPDFFNSAECEFQAKFAAGLGIDQRSNKIIPIVRRPCNIPSMLSCLSKVDFSRPSQQYCKWNWDKLIKSLGGSTMVCSIMSETAPALAFNSNNYLTGSPRIPEIESSVSSATPLPSQSHSQIVTVTEPDISSADAVSQYRNSNFSESNSSKPKLINSLMSIVFRKPHSKSKSKGKSN